ncbi:MAG TPA: hypothetical protein VF735_03870 [Pyrinomonadaceae bacterium]|jgi:hypothetical protein
MRVVLVPDRLIRDEAADAVRTARSQLSKQEITEDAGVTPEGGLPEFPTGLLFD